MEGPYKGAGVLIIDETERALFGRRKHNPCKDCYSVPGGGMEKSDGDNFLRCAIREANEELFDRLDDVLTADMVVQGVAPRRIRLPWFSFDIYLLKVDSGIIPARAAHEFSELVWVPRVGSLPEPLHPFMRQAYVSLIREYSKLKMPG